MEELEEKINFLMETVRQLERRVSILEKLLTDENSASDAESVTVTGAMDIPMIPRVKLSEDEILEIYNNNPDVLVNSTIKVVVTQESLLSKEVIFLEKTKAKIASYWIIATEDDNYWLLPKGKLRINTYNYETVNRLFNFDRYNSDIDDEFILDKLAKVAFNQNKGQWQLVESGKLKFIYTDEDQEETDSVKEQAKKSQYFEQYDSPESHKDTVDNRNLDDEAENNIGNDADLERLLVNLYNTKGASLASMAIVVIEKQNTINELVDELILGINSQSIFERNSLGEYWLFSFQQKTVYLVPRRDRDIMQDIDKIQKFFECRNYQSHNASNFQLIKPARVSPLDFKVISGDNWVIKGNEKWQLQETGVLQFG